MKRLILIFFLLFVGGICIAQKPQKETTYQIKKENLKVFKKPNQILIETPQGTYVCEYQNITNPNEGVIAFNGVKCTVFWSETWLSITYRNGKVIFWMFY